MKPEFLLAGLAGATLVLATGCTSVSESARSATQTIVTGHEGGAYAPVNTTKYDLENKSKFVLLDRGAQRSVTCSTLYERFTSDGRLEITANVRNRLNRRIQVQVDCVFKDAQGASTGDETPFQSLFLDENAQEAVKFTAMNTLAKGYTIRVREAR